MYSFDRSNEDAGNTYGLVCEAYDRILRRLGVPYVKGGLYMQLLKHLLYVR